MDKSLDIDPNYIPALNGKGIVLTNLGKSENALKYYKLVLDVDQNNPDASYGIGIALANLGKFKESLLFLQKAHELDPNSERIIEAGQWVEKQLDEHN